MGEQKGEEEEREEEEKERKEKKPNQPTPKKPWTHIKPNEKTPQPKQPNLSTIKWNIYIVFRLCRHVAPGADLEHCSVTKTKRLSEV